jgi:hypothetical protein
MFIRLHQTTRYLDDLNVDFMEAFCELWTNASLEAASCFAIGA